MSTINVFPDEDKDVNQSDENNEQEPLPFHNPLNPGDDTEITQEDIDNEQKFKEAMSERD